MNNKKGGFGAKFVLVLLLMIASAVGGAYAYRIFDGKIAVRDAKEAIADVDVSDYDEPEQVVIQNYIDDATKDLEKVQTRKEVYEILGEFISDVDKVQTKNEKALEEALKAAEEAKKEKENSNNYGTNNSGNNIDTSQPSDGIDTDSDNGGSYKSNQLKNGSEESEEGGSGILDSLLGSMNGN
jgi:hypothetical protein